ncbi:MULTISPECIES: LamG domain-containing protein [unclassified Nodularia (in: cyanobacteria)]|uniref:LamG domain-containing protein n=1 Tax=unclassified Nodularia (in: cyanobacteria) TaxID=2656917 RepID=UPI00187E7DFA|nr:MULTISPECIES: LamG domain-containing protein [unclassified Nodularia (in: cyanobacteria)]MBE9199088.1 LamG domain-containing protein [Nodularia sp. LEGE 06071]MCC2695775.1 LamG domain-containing protein [Nodularia sp. LEGE 04288]
MPIYPINESLENAGLNVADLSYLISDITDTDECIVIRGNTAFKNTAANIKAYALGSAQNALPGQTNDPAVKLLMHFDGNFNDAKGNTVNAIASPKLVSSPVKFGSAAFHYDSVSNGIQIPSTPSLALGTDNFCIEFWCYISNTSQKNFLLIDVNSGTDIIIYTTNNSINFYDSTLRITSPCPIGQWNFVSIIREETFMKMYVNGVKASADYSIGAISYGTATGVKLGNIFGSGMYVDELRLSIGSIQTPAVVPIAPFPG